MFDAFVITVSWALDLVFWEGLWAHPEDEAANIMIFILPWRVIRIVNSKLFFLFLLHGFCMVYNMPSILVCYNM